MVRTNGGYAMIDAIGMDASMEESATIKGLFAQFATAYATNKPVVLYNVEVDGYKYTPAYTVIVPLADGSYQFTFLADIYTIDSDDLLSKVE